MEGLMKKVILTLSIFLFFQTAHAEQLDGYIESIEITDPSLNGMNFCSRTLAPSFICHLKGYSFAEVLEENKSQVKECNAATIVGSDSLDATKSGTLFAVGTGRDYLVKRLRCSRRK
jgi:hypothetical protein